MSAETSTVRFPERVMRQIRLDAHRALVRARFCSDRSEVLNLRCVDNRRENETDFGAQLWYFDGFGVDEMDRRTPIFGVVEYSIQYELHELIEDGVFDNHSQRERFHYIYERDQLGPAWGMPLRSWIAVGVLFALIISAGLLLKTYAL